jgi:hypothetical protein
VHALTNPGPCDADKTKAQAKRTTATWAGPEHQIGCKGKIPHDEWPKPLRGNNQKKHDKENKQYWPGAASVPKGVGLRLSDLAESQLGT